MTEQDQIENLQKQIDALKKSENKEEEKPKLPGLGNQFEEIGKSFSEIRDNIPKIKIGNDNPKKNIPEDPFVEKMRRWLLIGLTILVAGGAFLILIFRILGRII